MEAQALTEPKAQRIVTRLVEAWDSGNRLVLATAVQQAGAELDLLAAGSPLDYEVRDLLLSVVGSLSDLLDSEEAADPRTEPRASASQALLHHARELIVVCGRRS
jgi:hypothetical protein